MIRYILILTTYLGVLSCNVDSRLTDAKEEWETDLANTKSDFELAYQAIVTNSKDTAQIGVLTGLYTAVRSTSQYIDTLRDQMGELDDKDVKNVDLIRRRFLEEGIADTLFRKVTVTYSTMIEVAYADTAKSRLKKARDLYTEETKKQFFQLIGPLGGNMILYGIESELLKDGARTIAKPQAN